MDDDDSWSSSSSDDWDPSLPTNIHKRLARKIRRLFGHRDIDDEQKEREFGKREHFVEEELDVEAREQAQIESYHRAARCRSGPWDGQTTFIKRHGDSPPRNFKKDKVGGPVWNMKWDDMVSKPVGTDWEYFVDNDFARGYLNLVKLQQEPAPAPGPAGDPDISPELPCPSCPALSLVTQESKAGDGIEVSRLLETSGSCALCKFFVHSTRAKTTSDPVEPITIWRDGSRQHQIKKGGYSFFPGPPLAPVLRLGQGGPPILTLCAGPESTEAKDIQIGLPTLPGPRDPVRFELFREWIRSCDKDCKCGIGPGELPNMMLDVGTLDNPDTVVLRRSRPRESARYVVLSHRWLKNDHFATYQCNIDERLAGIKFADLPQRFQDAVTVTRELGIRYLWIDSICIIQNHPDCSSGPDKCTGCLDAEFDKMDKYFGQAYCTIAATAAKVPGTGFLDHERKRWWMRVDGSSGEPLYVCKSIDNFHRHVENASLNKRGWVFQERALSRRTLHFTSKQAYFECGSGVRCETLTRMKKYVSSFSIQFFNRDEKMSSSFAPHS
jgi:hypothetical protein